MPKVGQTQCLLLLHMLGHWPDVRHCTVCESVWFLFMVFQDRTGEGKWENMFTLRQS